MEPEQWQVRSSTDPAHWPQFASAQHATPAPPMLMGQAVDDAAGPHSSTVVAVDGEAQAAALLEYALEWLDILPTPAHAARVPNSSRDSTPTAAKGAGPSAIVPCGEAAISAAESVSPVAMLNALLVSVNPGAASAPSASPTPPQQSASVSTCTAPAAADAASTRTDVMRPTMATPVPIVSAEITSWRSISDVAEQLLRHSKWLASGVSHAAGAAPRLPSADLLTHAYHHAFMQACTPSSSPPTGPAHALQFEVNSFKGIPSSHPASYRGCLVLLLFHRLRPLRLWSRDALLRLMCAAPAAANAASTPAAAAEASLSSLLTFALQLLCTLKHAAVLPGLVSFTETRAVSYGGAAQMGAVVVQERVQTAVEGVFHLLTILTAWDARFSAAMEAWSGAPAERVTATTAAVAAAKAESSPSLVALLSRCRATVVLLGGSLIIYGVQALHQSICRGAKEAWESQHRLHPLTSGGLSRLDPKWAAQAAMTQLLNPLNELLSSSPHMPKTVAVTALTIKKILAKVLVHCLLNNASGLAGSREEDAWRRTRLQWLWSFAATLEPPTTRVGAGALVCVPEKTAGWLLKPLLKNAEQQLQWASAMATAKEKPLSVAHDVEAARVAATDIAMLDKAVYGLYLLLDTAVETLPSLMPTRYFHEVLASYESQLLTLAIGGVVHTRTQHALRLHRLLFTADVRAFAAGAMAQQRHLHTLPSSDISSNPSLFIDVPSMCLQRVWLTLPTLITQVCKTSLVGAGSAAATRLPLSQVLVQLCGALTVLVEDGAAPCAQWLLLSPSETMSAAPPPFQWVVQRCLSKMSETLRDQHDMLEKAWLGLPLNSAAAVPPTVARTAATVAASHILSEERALLQLIYALPFAAADDGGLRRLGEQLSAVFCAGITSAVSRSMSTEAAEWVWRHVVLTQPALTIATSAPHSASAATAASPEWDISSSWVTNTARAQGKHWLRLLAECNWAQQDDWTVRCAWWMSALLADVVALESEHRRVLAEDVLLSLPTAPMLRVAAGAPRNCSEPADRMDDNEEGPSSHHVSKSLEYARQGVREREESSRLYVIAQHLFASVLRKAETYPRSSLDRLLLHISNALPAARVARDAAFRSIAQPLLVRLCPRRPEVHESLANNAAPWLQEWTAAARQSVTACLAEQERCFRQFEIEEETLSREQDEAARLAVLEAQLRQSNASKRAKEMGEVRRSNTALTASSASSTSLTSVPENAPGPVDSGARKQGGADGLGGVAAPASASVMLRQQRLFPDWPLQSAHLNSAAVKRQRSPTLSAPPPIVSGPAEPKEGGTDERRTCGVAAKKEEEVVVVDDPGVVKLEVDSDVEEVVEADASALDGLLPSSSLAPEKSALTPPLKAPKASMAASAWSRAVEAPAPPPTRLQQKLQAIHARNTHRVHHADQLQQLQGRLCRVAASTNLLLLQPPLINDIIGRHSQCMAPTVPVLPDVFVSAEAVLGDVSASKTSSTMPFGDAANAYAARFAPHIALELRCGIARSYENFVDGAAKMAYRDLNQSSTLNSVSEAGWQHGHHSGAPPPYDMGASGAEKRPIPWKQLLPLHPSIPNTCFAVHSATPSWPVNSSGNASVSDAHDSLSFRFAIRACADLALAQQGVLQPSAQQGSPPPSRSVDPVVRAVADEGFSAGLSEGDVVLVLLPLHALAATWVERQLGVSLASLSEEEQTARVQEALSLLPRSWHMLGCLTQVCYVESLQLGRRTAQLCTYPPVEARGSLSSSSVPPIRFLHAMRMHYSSPHNHFFVRKLASLNSSQMELAALHRIDSTRFAATLYDPCCTVPLNAAYCSWITDLRTATGPARQPLLAQLRARLLLQRQLNDWQIHAIIAVLYATCQDWDEGEAMRCLGPLKLRAPEVLLIEGPPGTGKTQTIGSLTLNLLHHLSRSCGANCRVLVCAPSNNAVDEALLRVVRLREQLVESSRVGSDATGVGLPAYAALSGGILRIGVRNNVDPDVLRLAEPVFLDDVVSQSMVDAASKRGGGGRASSMAGSHRRRTVCSSIISSASIIFSTLGSLHHISRHVQGLSFDVVIVDEASQGTEPAVLQALVLARSKCVLVGDSKQLQPTVHSPEASRCGLRRSLLVRMLACGHKSFLLRTQYRMHPDICAFPNAYFYGSKLETDRSVLLRARTSSRSSDLLRDNTLPSSSSAAVPHLSDLTIAQRLGRCPRFVFADVPGSVMERRRGRSLLNRKEALAVVQYMRQLRSFLRLSVSDMAPQLGIITFYNAQKDLILSMLTQEELESGLQVASVDSFQGKEKRIVLLSCVRTVLRSELLAQLLRTYAAKEKGESGSQIHQDGDGQAIEERAEHRRVDRFGLGFLSDGHRLNVALTRAQDLCVCFGSRDSLKAVGEAVMAARGRPHSSSGHALTTADSAPDDVVQQLDADGEDPLALYRMLQHAEEHDVCLHPPARPSVPREAPTNSVEVAEISALPVATSACVHYDAKTPLSKELMMRARVTEEST
ncbi:hypothetical protein ABL78_5279 [Leptomonas seymouri]|uniref:DNA2/NAM7 helicase helicase domain-containing protein n=1 Tax=Leptomonas seymouri TaxID=5684 RepID=A0A0N1I514_LEPSE|nr:hypothetical protein ABL78_5279 [Leptomonas seymouri]|eukprot:KPI85658.1 hypothetical protein ABL78_5279 [Leptomonas seymouri]